MVLGSFIKKQFIDIIQWTESDDETLAMRFPTADLEIQHGAQLTVRESQMALFVDEGRIADLFEPGLYTLSTQTLPVLTYLKNWDKLFESPFKSEVYFYSTRPKLGRRWGTPQAVTLRDQDFGIVQLRAFGQFDYRLVDPRKFYEMVSGTREHYSVDEVERQLIGEISANLAQAFGSSNIPFLDLAANQQAMSDTVKQAMAPKFANLGLELIGLQVISVTLPDALQEALNKRISMGIVGNLQAYTQYQTAESIPLAAANPGGVAGAAASMAAGMAMGQAMTQHLVPGLAAPAGQGLAAAAPVAAAPTAPEPGPRQKLAELKALLDDGLITADDYEKAKQAVLAKLAS